MTQLNLIHHNYQHGYFFQTLIKSHILPEVNALSIAKSCMIYHSYHSSDIHVTTCILPREQKEM